MSQNSGHTVFSRVDPEALRGSATKSTSGEQSSTKPTTRPEKRNRRRYPRLRKWAVIAGPLFWSIFVIDVFIFDIGQLISQNFPEADSVLQYRFLFFTVLLATSALFSRSRSFYGSIAFAVFYPVVLAFWIVPNFLWRHRSWTTILGVIHVALGVVGGFRRGVLLWASIVLAVAFTTVGLAWTSIAALALAGMLTVFSCWSLVVQAFKPDRFLKVQQRAFSWWASDPARFQLPNHLRGKVNGPPLGPQESNEIVDRAAYATVTYYAGRYWADRLEDYTQSKAFVSFGVLAVVRYYGLFAVYVMVAVSALYDLDSTQYRVEDGPPGLVMFAQYAFASLASSEIYGMVAQGDLARALWTIAKILGYAVIGMVAVGLWQGYKYASSASSGEAPIAQIRRDAAKVGQWATSSYAMPIDRLALSLFGVGNGTVFALMVTISKFSDYNFGFPDEDKLRANYQARAGSGLGAALGRKPGRGAKGRSRRRLEGR